MCKTLIASGLMEAVTLESISVQLGRYLPLAGIRLHDIVRSHDKMHITDKGLLCFSKKCFLRVYDRNLFLKRKMSGEYFTQPF